MLSAVKATTVKLSPGDIVDQKYRVLRLLGAGGMGSVYEAENIRVQRRVAIKVMHKVRDEQDLVRFEREARTAQISSPHIVQVFDLGNLADGVPYMVMEYLAGETLGDRLARVQRLPPKEFLPIARQVLEALGAAHRAGIIHRDLKPDNIFLANQEGSATNCVKLLDFGISKFTEAARKAADVSLTKSGIAVGTPQYMSPEQVQGSKDLDHRTDLYSLGVICYRCLSGELPFQSQDVAPLLVQILLEDAKPIHEIQSDLEPTLSALVARAMARRAEQRFQTAAEFQAALDDWQQRGAVATVLEPPVAAAPASASASPIQNNGGFPNNERAYATNAPWASTAAVPITSRRVAPTVLIAFGMALLGVVGMLVAYRLVTSGNAEASEVLAATSAATPAAAPPAAPPPPVVSPAPVPNSVEPRQPPAPARVTASETHPVAAVASKGAAVTPKGVAAAVAAPPPPPSKPPEPETHVAPIPAASATPPPSAAKANAPGEPAGVKPADDPDDPEHRHMSRGLK